MSRLRELHLSERRRSLNESLKIATKQATAPKGGETDMQNDVIKLHSYATGVLDTMRMEEHSFVTDEFTDLRDFVLALHQITHLEGEPETLRETPPLYRKAFGMRISNEDLLRCWTRNTYIENTALALYKAASDQPMLGRSHETGVVDLLESVSWHYGQFEFSDDADDDAAYAAECSRCHAEINYGWTCLDGGEDFCEDCVVIFDIPVALARVLEHRSNH